MIDAVAPFVRLDVSGVDDPEAGMAVIMYVAGCSKRCPGCHNPELQRPDDYPLMTAGELNWKLEQFFSRNPAVELVEAIVFQGGEWGEYPTVYAEVAAWAQQKGFRTVLYTGQIYEDLLKSVQEVSDWVIDGPWDQANISVFPPSSNQRVFHQGRRVEPDQLPLYKHLLESEMLQAEEEKQGGLA